jgi:hypothetical protein
MVGASIAWPADKTLLAQQVFGSGQGPVTLR